MSLLKSCRICSSQDFEEVLDLGNQPWCNNFLKEDEVGKEIFYPLLVVLCNKCKVSQLNYTVKKEIMFGDHTYLSGVTSSLSMHFKHIRDEILNKFQIKNKRKILDVGSNDGTFLKHFKDINWDVLGVESSKKISQIANQNKINTLNKFFNFEVSKEINEKFDFINASGVFFHLEELHSFTEGIKHLLKDDGVFIVQFLYMKSIIENTAFDQIYHEHLLYYNLSTLSKLLEIYDLEIFDAKLHEIHGGQMTAYISKKNTQKKSEDLKFYETQEKIKNINDIQTYINFKKKIEQLKKKNQDFIYNSLSKNKLIFGMGAPAKGNTLLNYFKFTQKEISKLVEINPLRKNLYSPGSHIQIELEKELDQVPDIYYVLAWNFKKEILKNNKHLLKEGVEFYFPINVGSDT